MTRMKKPAQILILIIAIAMIAAGINANGFREVMNKAVMICMECIGIG